MKKLITLIIIALIGLNVTAQQADSLQTEDTDTIKKPKDKTIKIMVGDKELLEVDVNAEDFDMDDFDGKKNGDTTKIRVGKKNIIIIDDDKDKKYSSSDDEDDSWYDEEDEEDEDYDYSSKKFKGHWGGIELGLNNYLNSNKELSLPANGQFMELNTSKSIEFSLNFADKGFSIYKDRFGIVTGMGIKWNKYHFDNNIKLNAKTNPLSADVVDADSINYTKNRLGVTYLTVPVLLEYHIPVGKKNKPIYFSTGVIGGLKLGSNLKQEYVDLSGNDRKDKFKNDYNLSPYTASLTARIGYKNVNLYANYSLTPLFEKNKGPELYPFTIGISLLN